MAKSTVTELEADQLKALVWPLFAAALLISGKEPLEWVPNRTDDLVKAYMERLPK